MDVISQRHAFLQKFASSLTYLAKVDVVSDKTLSNSLAEFSALLSKGNIPAPIAFHSYFKLLRATQTNNLRQIKTEVRALISAGFVSDNATHICPLTPDHFTPAESRLLRQQFCSESLFSRQITRLPEALSASIQLELKKALNLLAKYAPQANLTFTTITREIIPVYGRAHNGMVFDGCSSLERWGAILINMRRIRSPLIMAETLVHESAHSLLFAVQLDDYLAINPATDRFPSPLRIDPRPIDGIFHATFVLSFMIAFLVEVAQHKATTSELKKQAETTLSERTKAFCDGYGVLLEHAKLTDKGREILNDAYARVPQALHAA